MRSALRLCFLPLLVLSVVALEGAEGLSGAKLTALKAATVFIRNEMNGDQSQGTGFLLQRDLIVTNSHVVAALEPGSELLNRSITVCFNSGEGRSEVAAAATLVAVNQSFDLAYLKLGQPATVAPVKLADAKVLRETLPIFIAGFPFGERMSTAGINPAVTIGTGTVSSLRRDEFGRVLVVQIDGVVNPGNSGGPMVTANGDLVAVTVAKLNNSGIGFGIPAQRVEEDLRGAVRDLWTKADAGGGLRLDMLATDPLQQITRMSVEWWAATPDAKRTVDPKTGFEAYGAEGDGPRKKVVMTKDRMGHWIGIVDTGVVPAGKVLLCRPLVTVGGRERPLGIGGMPDARGGAPGRGAAGGEVADRGTGRQAGGTEKKGSGEGLATTWKAPLVVVTAKPKETVQATTSRELDGRSFGEVTSLPQAVDLGGPVSDVVAAPSGEVLYAIPKNDSCVAVIDPGTWKRVTEIAVPQTPVSLWADSQIIGVACTDSKAVVLIDPQKREVIRSVRCPELDGWVPVAVCGRGPDGSLTTAWQQVGGSEWNRALVQVPLSGGARVMGQGKGVSWGAWLDGQTFFMNGLFTLSPAGTGDLIGPGWPSPRPAFFNNKLFGDVGFHCDTGRVFITFDGEGLALPRRAIPDPHSRTSTRLQTFIVSRGIDRILLQIPGAAVCEVPSQRMLVTLDLDENDQHEAVPLVRYVSRSTGRVDRVVRLVPLVAGPEAPMWTTYMLPHCGAVYIPGHELMLMPRTTSGDDRGKGLSFLAFRCGPPAATAGGATAPGGDPTARVANDPPASGKPAQALRFQPSVTVDGGTPVYHLVRPLPGMAIDAKTGLWTWTPTTAQSGKWRVVINATVAGKEIPVVSWSIEIE